MACGTAWQRSSNSVKVGDKFGSAKLGDTAAYCKSVRG